MFNNLESQETSRLLLRIIPNGRISWPNADVTAVKPLPF
jgi:hypothetical protein